MSDLALVTGACGFVGSHMVDLLVEKGFRVRAMDLPGADKKWIEGHLKSGKAEFVAVDLTQKDTLKPAVKGVDYVFHPASLFDYAASWEALEKVNVQGARNLCEALLEEGKLKRMVHWSTAGVYGVPDPSRQPTKEDDPKGINCNLYEKSKWLQEQLVLELYQKQKLPCTVIRPAPIYGPRSVYGVAGIVFLIARGQLSSVATTARGRTPFSHVKDICGAAFYLSQKNEAEGQAYNVADDTEMTMYQFAHFIASVVGADMMDVPVPLSHVIFWVTLAAKWSAWRAAKTKTRPKIELETVNYIARSYWFSNEKLKSTGYVLKYPEARVGFMETIEWYRKEGFLPKLNHGV